MKVHPFLYLQAKFDGLQTPNGRSVDHWKEAFEFCLVRERSYSPFAVYKSLIISMAIPGKAC